MSGRDATSIVEFQTQPCIRHRRSCIHRDYTCAQSAPEGAGKQGTVHSSPSVDPSVGDAKLDYCQSRQTYSPPFFRKNRLNGCGFFASPGFGDAERALGPCGFSACAWRGGLGDLSAEALAKAEASLPWAAGDLPSAAARRRPG